MEILFGERNAENLSSNAPSRVSIELDLKRNFKYLKAQPQGLCLRLFAEWPEEKEIKKGLQIKNL